MLVARPLSMMLMASLDVSLVVGLSQSKAVKSHFDFDVDCPVMPEAAEEWENSYLWGVFIDGKDAHEGPHVYDWDQKFFYKISAMLSNIYKKEKTHKDARKYKLTIEKVEKMRNETYGDQIYTPPGDLAAKGIMPECTDKMACRDVKQLLKHIPPAFYSYTHYAKVGDQYDYGCPKGLTAKTSYGVKRDHLKNLIDSYNTDIDRLQDEGADKDKLLERLVAFLRGFAFLHAFQGGNGRLRNMLLQRELRRLNIACATMMYNYNKDAFVDGFPRYLAKVKEGIEKFKLAVHLGANPWLDETIKEKHVQDFEALSGLEKCTNSKKQYGSGGSISLQRDHLSGHDDASISLEDLA